MDHKFRPDHLLPRLQPHLLNGMMAMEGTMIAHSLALIEMLTRGGIEARWPLVLFASVRSALKIEERVEATHRRTG